jgi:leucyl aminopeptidase
LFVMDVRLIEQLIEDIHCDALVIGVSYRNIGQQSNRLLLAEKAKEVNGLLGGLIQTMYDDGEFKAELGEIITIHPMGKLAANRVIVMGLGMQEKMNTQSIRRASAIASRHVQQTGAHQIALALNAEEWNFDLKNCIQAEVEGALLGLYTFKKYKQANANGNRGITRIDLLENNANEDLLGLAVDQGIALAEATNFARDLVNEPPNVVTPSELAHRASAMAKQFGLECQVLDRPQMQELGMGGLLGVAQGSAQPPKFIILRYRGAPESENQGVALVGKGITFDTGGISLKPAEGMYRMKGDMAGAAAVIGAMYAIASLKPAVNVTALVPTTENMPGGTAYRPGDILRMMNGKTIEIVNTDAEGRLVLADALSYAVKNGLSPIIDVATLTGGIAVALGPVMSGMFCNDEKLSKDIIAAGQIAGEKLWPMPLDDEYKEAIQSDIADIKQTGGKYASAVTAAKILEHFVDDAQWAHLDIAGTSFIDTKKPYQEYGATGVAVRTLAEFVLRRAE